MYRKITLILVLAIALATFLVVRPYIFNNDNRPSIVDRLPDGDFLGKADVLRLISEFNGMLYYHKIPYREFMSEEFVLAQAKNYGIQLQEPTYFFANEDLEFGALIQIRDSSKVSEGVQRIGRTLEMKERTISHQRVFHFTNSMFFLSYSDEYLFVYHGKHPEKYFHRVIDAKDNQISPSWRGFLNQANAQDKSLLIYSNWKPLQDVQLSTVMAYPSIDSTDITFHTYLRGEDTLLFSQKDEPGPELEPMLYTKRSANLHLNIERLQKNKEHPLYTYLVKQAKKISFPMNDFIQTWDGHLCFRQGGYFNIKEKYIETELDENFMPTEVAKYRNLKVLGFSLYYSVNSKGKQFWKTLIKKGILTEQEDKYYFLLSPPLGTQVTDTSHLFHSSPYLPKFVTGQNNYVIWTHEQTPYQISIDSLNTFECFSTIKFPVENLLRSADVIQ